MPMRTTVSLISKNQIVEDLIHMNKRSDQSTTRTEQSLKIFKL